MQLIHAHNSPDNARAKAAVQIQRAWRKHNNMSSDRYLNADLRWKDAAIHAQLKVCSSETIQPLLTYATPARQNRCS
jgi:hypothetical protein